MAQYSIKIPDAAFLADGPLYGRDEKSAIVLIPFSIIGEPGTSFTVNVRNIKVFEDFEFHPPHSQAYQDFLQLMDKGLIEVYLVGGALQSVADMIALFQSNYQEL